ncbi:CLUMA_CG016454, isoform A [Clunio marinus]|uniref:glutathione transferase n=1 Tax=Clunio marinus TaxID=568069 RepID=A0A1J1ITH5_9DIPT|nr:CLUMA_CG016454, isoform A [Clunio marinus]
MSYKLIYFNSKALGEPIRFLLAYGDIEYEDFRIDFLKQWPTWNKESFPFHQIPILEVDGLQMNQSLSICRFLAKRVGLVGSNDIEDYLIDSMIDNINDFRWNFAIMHYETDPSIQEIKRKELHDKTIPFYLEKLEKIAKDGNGHFALKRLTWVDVYFAGVIDYLNFMAKKDLLTNCPNLQKVVDNVLALEKIKKWVEKRPKTIS